MKFLLILLATAVLCGALPAGAATPQSEKWEYGALQTGSGAGVWFSGEVQIASKTIKGLSILLVAQKIIGKPSEGVYSLINELGEVGWELVTVIEYGSGGTSYQFKRRKTK